MSVGRPAGVSVGESVAKLIGNLLEVVVERQAASLFVWENVANWIGNYLLQFAQSACLLGRVLPN